jgi:hypothetical protein
LRKRQIAEFVEDDEVEPGEEVGKPALARGATFRLKTVD